MRYYFLAFKKYATFSGRASRKEFWWFLLVHMIVGILVYIGVFILAIFLSRVYTIDNTFLPMLFGLYFFVSIIPYLSLTCRRLHDIGKSAWWLLIFMIPLVGIIVLIMCAFKGNEEANKYGEVSIA